MAADHRVNSAQQSGPGHCGQDAPAPPRWWLRRPAAGVLVAMMVGLASFWVTLSIGRPDDSVGATVKYLVILPIALLLPAVALGGAMVAWHAFQSTRGRMRLILTAPAFIALAFNAAAVVLFMRWIVRIVSP